MQFTVLLHLNPVEVEIEANSPSEARRMACNNYSYKGEGISSTEVFAKCPECEGDMHEVPDPESGEIYLWCNNCDVSMDSDGGYTK